MRTILFELNEVPWRILDWYIDGHPESAFARVVREASTYTTVTEDAGDLHPWVTWPTLHRGVSNDRHGIAHLGQDLRDADQAYPAVWRLLAERGMTVGVAGSLQSYPLPPAHDSYAFYIPDTYAPKPETLPPQLSRFQDLNLRLTKQNRRNVSTRMAPGDALGLAAELSMRGLRPATAARIAGQLASELTDRIKVNRRRGIQSAIYFDVFLRQLKQGRPQFCTFFSNHVAAAMHRYWAASFPGDYSEFKLPADWCARYGGELEWAMGLADDFLAELMAFCEQNRDYRLLIASSMGQAATHAEMRDGYFGIVDVARFLSCIGIEPHELEPAMAMAPDVSVHLKTPHAVERFRDAKPMLEEALPGIDLDLDERGMAHLQLMIPNDIENPVRPPLIGNRLYSLEEAGVGFVPDQDKVATTAYHVPNGIFLNWRPGCPPVRGQARRAVSSLEITPAILAAHGAPPPAYMARPSLAL